jgi:error-prone DNA polymerase
MGFYAPDSLAHEAQRRGITLRPADVTRSEVECTVEPGLAVRFGLGYVRDVAREDVEAIVRARAAGGPFRSLGDLAARAGAGRAALEQLAWSGACDTLVSDAGPHARRTALWELGVAVPGRRVPGGTQLSLPLDLPVAPGLRPLDRWQHLLAEYATTGVTLSGHVLAVLRPRLPRETVRSCELAALPHGRPVTIAGLVVARQRPGTASGIVFVLLEDETGTCNLVIPSALYEGQARGLIRTEPLLLLDGRLEKLPAAGGAINILVERVRAVESALSAPRRERDLVGEPAPAATVHQLPTSADPGEDDEAARVAASIRAVAPPVMSFAAGRRR